MIRTIISALTSCLLFSCSQPSVEVNKSSKDSIAPVPPATETCWKGWLGDHKTIFIHYSVHDSIVTGEIEYLSPEKRIFSIAGSIQADSLYKLYEIDQKGIIHGYLQGYIKENTFDGAHFTIDKSEELKFILSAHDTTIYSPSYVTDVKNVFGTYHYEYHYQNGKTHIYSDLTVEKTNDSLMRCYISSKGRGTVNSDATLSLDSVKIVTGTGRPFQIKKYNTKVVFYKNMALLFDSGVYAEDEYGDYSLGGKVTTTKEGVFIKLK